MVRRFDPRGAEHFAREIEMVHDKQHYLVLEAITGRAPGHFGIPVPVLVQVGPAPLRRQPEHPRLGHDLLDIPTATKCRRWPRFRGRIQVHGAGDRHASGVATQPKLFAQETIRTAEGYDPPEDRK